MNIVLLKQLSTFQSDEHCGTHLRKATKQRASTKAHTLADPIYEAIVTGGHDDVRITVLLCHLQ
jgi:hypothetical protein